MFKITLSMIVKNEEKYLRECLESVKDVVDEIVIVDTGSTDNTLNIAEKYDAKIFHFKWINDFSAARNYALLNSSGDWILYLDADERLTPDSIEEIKKIKNEKEKLGIKCSVISYDENQFISQSMKYCRLFTNDKKVKFSGKVHEQIEPSLLENNFKIIESTIKINHVGYCVSKNELKEKAKRNLDLLLIEYERNKSSYIEYQIGNSYEILEDTLKSNQYFKKAISDKNLNNEYKTVCLLQLADYAMRNNNLSEAKEYVDRGIKNNSSNSLLNIITGQVYAKFNNDKAFDFIRNAHKQILAQKSSKNHKDQEIFVQEKKVIYEGIIISLQFQNKSELTYYTNILNKLNEIESGFINKIINNSLQISTEGEWKNLINNDNINFYLSLFEKNQNEAVKLEFYSSLYEQNQNNPRFINAFGSFLLNNNYTEEAKVIFETALTTNYIEDSTYFYLVSLYLSTNNLAKLKDLLHMMEVKINKDSLSYNKFNLLKEKLSPIIFSH